MIEKNHEFIRYILPKGISFDKLLQTDIDLMLNHISNFARESFSWSSPYEVAKVLMGK